MALSPKDLQQLNQNEVDIVNQSERRIDDYLRASFDLTKKEYTIRLAKNTLNDRIGTELIKRYNKAGWHTTYSIHDVNITLRIPQKPTPPPMEIGDRAMGHYADDIQERKIQDWTYYDDENKQSKSRDDGWSYR